MEDTKTPQMNSIPLDHRKVLCLKRDKPEKVPEIIPKPH